MPPPENPVITVLYVDDDATHCDIVKKFLESKGDFTVDTARSAKKALGLENFAAYHAIVSDYEMPGSDGIWFLQQIRASGNRVPFILFTGRGREEIVIQALNEGADFYLQKGGEPAAMFAELAHKIRTAVGKRRAEREQAASEERFRELFNNMRSGVAVYEAVDNGADFVFHDFNRAAEMIEKVPRKDVIGRRVSEVFPGVREFGLMDVFFRVWQTGQAEHHPVALYRDNRISGWRENFVYRLPSGEIVAVYDDITERRKAEEALRENEEQFRAVFENANDAITVLGFAPDGLPSRFILVNENACRLTGYTREELLLRSPRDLDDPEEWNDAGTITKKISDQGHLIFERVLVRKDGKKVPVEISTHVFVLNGRKVMLSIFRDISERKTAEQALRDNELLLRLLYDNANDEMLLIRQSSDGPGRIILANAQVARATGYTREELLTMSPRDFVPAGCAQKFIPGVLEKLKTEGYALFESLHRRKDGSIYPVEVSIRRFSYKGDDVDLSIVRDITGRRKAETSLRESEEKYHTLFERMTRGIFYQMADGTIIDANPAALQMFGLRREQFLGKDSYDSRWNVITEDGAPLPPEEHPSMVALRTGQPVENRVVGIGIPGRNEYTWARVAAEPQFRPGETDPYRVFVIMDDITRQRNAEQALQAMFRSMVGTTGIDSLKNITGNITTWLGADCVMIGEIQPDRDTVKVLAMVLDGKDIGDFSYTLRGTPCENAAQKGFCCYPDNVRDTFPDAKDLADLNIRGYIGTPLRSGGGDVMGVLCVLSRSPMRIDRATREIVDIIAVKASAEIERRRVEAALRESEVKFRTYIETCPESVFVMDAGGRCVDANPSASTMTGFPWEELCSRTIDRLVPEETRAGMGEWLRELRGTGRFAREVTLQKKDGSLITVMMNAVSLPDGMSIAFCADVTDRKKAEDTLRVANRKLTLLSGITRHDIRNQLVSLNAYLALSHDSLGDASRMAEFIRIEEEITRTLEHQILFTREYEKLGISAPVWQNVRESIHSAAAAMDLTGVTLDLSRLQEIEIYADSLFRNVLHNLLDNALRHGGDSLGTIRFSSGETVKGMLIVCEDNGAGIGDDDKLMIFERGFGKHTGFGLFFIREILAITGITIQETGEPGKGARFEILVPKGEYRFRKEGGARN